MRMYDIIAKKRDGGELSDEEIQFFINGYVSGEIPDYQVSSLLMAIYFQGMTDRETASLTMCMAKSGEMVDLSSIDGIKVDKHSTGGVGDKTTLIISPIVASLGVRVAKMSGRGLGHTGGTVDKMESIPGMQTSIDREKFFDIVRKVGVSVIGQSGNLVPADKKLYALRDVTATIESIPLIASSIMSKKIAAGSDCILLDVKTGSGAFMKTVDDSIKLAQAMVAIGEHVGRKTIALITDMDRPLGNAIGNSLEIMEVCDTLKGHGPEDLTEICIELAANMLYLAGKGDLAECKKLARRQIDNGEAFAKLKEMVAAQGGDTRVLDDSANFPQAKIAYEVLAQSEGYLYAMNTERCGISSVELGAGREKKEDSIDYSAGIMLRKKIGDYVKKGDVIAVFYTSEEGKCKEAEKIFQSAVSIRPEAPKSVPVIHARVTVNGVEKL
ncbi:pyrimidine-nucleoside phosphorylase [Caproiciproducens galactitolivorans]|uniref:Pyrimidine-nucleoside phosphorylase n=1 Tax=Caproiciproducens galactitolivorans TaxID=642589 RepID=A0A4Z0XYQ5_9FIRM|nr:pyrimidine-nucleoside phosphorylase [Caproiciproducens galactitolivorans]TGJ75627.1 pyrimidine-nucleoside phosphorylase [Caproiciproducens galactitolivorans]